jgi:hypothetical protein
MTGKCRLVSLVLLSSCIVLLSACEHRGTTNPREAAVAWSRAILHSDSVSATQYGGGAGTDIGAVRVSLGLPPGASGVDVAVVGQSDHEGTSEVDIVFRKGTSDVSPRSRVGVWETDSRWLVAGVLTTASPVQRSAIDRVATDYLEAIASNSTPRIGGLLGGNAATDDLQVMRASAFGRFAKTPLTGFKVVSVVDERVFPVVNCWYATANVTMTDGGKPTSFAVELSGPTSYSGANDPRINDALIRTP